MVAGGGGGGKVQGGVRVGDCGGGGGDGGGGSGGSSGAEERRGAPAAWKGTDPLFEQKGWCQFPGRFEQDFLRKPRKVLL